MLPSRSRTLVQLAVSLLVLLGLVTGAAARRVQLREEAPPQAQPRPRHDTAFAAVPLSKLEIRAVEYDGSTNGSLTVQIRNPTKRAQTFSAAGLYFVPAGDPDEAPQRLGAVGPLRLDGVELTQLTVSAGATVEVTLDVFCIDSHRSSPSPQNVFSVGKKRMPKQLATAIEERADGAVKRAAADGAPAARPAAKAAIQAEVWRTRDAKWVELDGEGAQEATK